MRTTNGWDNQNMRDKEPKVPTHVPGYGWKKIDHAVNDKGVPITLRNGLKARLYRLSSDRMRETAFACKHIRGRGHARFGLSGKPNGYYVLHVEVNREYVRFVFADQWIQDLVWLIQQDQFYDDILLYVYGNTAYDFTCPIGKILADAVRNKRQIGIAALLTT